MTLCTLFYLVEYAAAPRVMMSLSSHGAAAGSCCHEEGKKGQCPKSSKECNPSADCCLSCPMCYVMVLPASMGHAVFNTSALEYPVWMSSYVYLYHSSCWKPPNAA